MLYSSWQHYDPCASQSEHPQVHYGAAVVVTPIGGPQISNSFFSHQSFFKIRDSILFISSHSFIFRFHHSKYFNFRCPPKSLFIIPQSKIKIIPTKLITGFHGLAFCISYNLVPDKSLLKCFKFKFVSLRINGYSSSSISLTGKTYCSILPRLITVQPLVFSLDSL